MDTPIFDALAAEVDWREFWPDWFVDWVRFDACMQLAAKVVADLFVVVLVG